MENCGDLVLISAGESFDVFQKASADEKYVKYHFCHVIDDKTNADLYRIIRAFGARRISRLEFEPIFGNMPIINRGEWECAFRESGAEDFSGGFHGDEIITEVFLKVDGKNIEPDSICRLDCSKIEFFQKSYLTRCNSKGDNIAVHEKYYVIENGSIVIKQKLLWLQPVHISYGSMGMIPVIRTAGGLQLTDTAVILKGCNSGIECSVPTVNDTTTVVSKHNKNVSKFRIFGRQSGISVTMEHIKKPVLDSEETHLSVRPYNDNKIYFGFCRDYKTTIGEKFEAYSKYTFEF